MSAHLLVLLVQELLNAAGPVRHYAAVTLHLGGHVLRCQRLYGGRHGHLRWAWLCR